MDAAFLIIISVSAIGGFLLATPLLSLAGRLLSTVPAAEAAPVMATTKTAGAVASPTLDLTITPAWRWTLRIGLVLLMPLTVWRALAPASIFQPRHLPPYVGLVLIVVCVAALALSAALDGATHLVFVEVIAPPAVILLVVGLFEGQGVWWSMLLGGIVGGGVFLMLYLAGRLLYGTDALGFGDVQLATAFGILLGWQVVISAFVVGLILMVLTVAPLLAFKRMTTRTYLPIGAFLALGALAGLLLLPPPWL